MKDKNFNVNQNRAIRYGEGPLLIVAGPGSGKTTVLTHRIKYIIDDLHAAPESVLVMTFSRAAAEEMKERFLNTGTIGADKVVFGTFHSVFYKVLKTAYGKLARNYIFDDESQDKIRFDEMLELTAELLREREDICKQIRKKYRWVLVDEFQDIDRLQYEILRLIAPPCSRVNLTAVGDDDQSIYAFRGADPGIMLGFEKDYPGTEKVILDVNYRSMEEITGVAMRLIRHNVRRFDKNIVSAKGRGGEVRILEFSDAKEEYSYIADEIGKSIKEGRAAGKIAVLHRNNAQPWQFEGLMMDRGLNGINLMTFHKSKGLEFEEVWIIDANDRVIPGAGSYSEETVEEERRAFYVAMTRAKYKLRICYSRKYKKHLVSRSVFIEECIK
ncbi:MAG: UvrD family DEAD/DEAH box helicase [Lachnospiraceae bacterium]|nr:UvrD family DEAD/DEAH box helicase [Lachnospiraceae bacterium]